MNVGDSAEDRAAAAGKYAIDRELPKRLTPNPNACANLFYSRGQAAISRRVSAQIVD
jgi:hypothetical protein